MAIAFVTASPAPRTPRAYEQLGDGRMQRVFGPGAGRSRIGRCRLRVSIRPWTAGSPRRLLQRINDSGANLDLAARFMRALGATESVILDVAHTGGWPSRLLPRARLVRIDCGPRFVAARAAAWPGRWTTS